MKDCFIDELFYCSIVGISLWFLVVSVPLWFLAVTQRYTESRSYTEHLKYQAPNPKSQIPNQFHFLV